MEKVKKFPTTWLYEGPPEKIALSIEAAPQTEGGYVVALKLTNGVTRILASRDPVRYVGQLQNQLSNFGNNTRVSEVMVSMRNYQYQAIKRWVGKTLVDFKVGPDSYNVESAVLTRQINEAFQASAGMLRA